MASVAVFAIRADLGGFRHHQIQLTLRQVIEILQFDLPGEQMAAKPFAGLFLRWDL